MTKILQLGHIITTEPSILPLSPKALKKASKTTGRNIFWNTAAFLKTWKIKNTSVQTVQHNAFCSANGLNTLKALNSKSSF